MTAKSVFSQVFFFQMNKICNFELKIVNLLLLLAVSFIKPCEIVLGEKLKLLYNNVRQIKNTAGNIKKYRLNLD